VRSVDPGVQYKVGEAARDESNKISGGSRIDDADTGSERPGRVREIRKETSEWEGESGTNFN